MKNIDTWQFAHKYFGKLWFRLGLVLLIFSAIPMLASFAKDIETVGSISIVMWIVQLVALVIPIIPTEIKLKKSFEQNGKRKKAI